MRIIVDAMGGDHAPEAAVLGAIDAVKNQVAEVTLVGRGEDILKVLGQHGIHTLPQGVEIANADDVVDMHDDLKMLADGAGDAFVSAGSTGALLSAATLLVKRVKGVRRAAMGPLMPNKMGGKTLIIDCGANAECTPEFLLQFGLIGAMAYRKSMGVEPRVGLLNNGTEDSKGGDLQKQAHALLKEAGENGLINFIGNVEGRDVPLGNVDVVVCDGFSGNVLIKSIEGTAMFMGSAMKKMFKKSVFSKIGYLLCKSGVKDMMKLLDYREIGGTQFLGLRKPVIKAHGSSDRLAFANAVAQAARAVEDNIADELEAQLRALKERGAEHV